MLEVGCFAVGRMTGRWHGAVGRGFVVINASHNRRYESGFGSGVTRGALLLHELGHALGLAMSAARAN